MEKYCRYCPQCKQDLCDKCGKEHKKHNFIEYESKTPDITKIKNDLNKIKENIDDLRFIIDDMKDHLDGAMKILEQYYEIGQDIFAKFELYNQNLKNHRVFENLKNLNESNERVIKDLDNILNNNNLKSKINMLINIYESDRRIYTERKEFSYEDCVDGFSNENNSIINNVDSFELINNNLSKKDKNE